MKMPEECAGCEMTFRPDDAASVVVLDGQQVHEDFHCINQALGPDNPLVQRIEEAMAGPQPLSAPAKPYWIYSEPAPPPKPPKPPRPEVKPELAFAVHEAVERIRRRFE